MDKPKFKAGDRVKVIAEWPGCRYKIGDEFVAYEYYPHDGPERIKDARPYNEQFYLRPDKKAAKHPLYYMPECTLSLAAPREFKVGDRVRVKRNLKVGYVNEEKSGYVNEKMASLGGQIVTIRRLSTNPAYNLLIEEDGWNWHTDWVEFADEASIPYVEPLVVGDWAIPAAFEHKDIGYDEEMAPFVGKAGAITKLFKNGALQIHGHAWPRDALTKTKAPPPPRKPILQRLKEEMAKKKKVEYRCDYVIYGDNKDEDGIHVKINMWCHSSFNYPGVGKPTEVAINQYRYLNAGCGAETAVGGYLSKADFITYCDYIAKESPWKVAFKSSESHIEGCEMRVDVHSNILTAACIAYRASTEWPEATKLFCRFVEMGIPKDAAFLMSRGAAEKDGKYTYGAMVTHSVIEDGLRKDNLLEFFAKGYKDQGKDTFQTSQRYAIFGGIEPGADGYNPQSDKPIDDYLKGFFKPARRTKAQIEAEANPFYVAPPSGATKAAIIKAGNIIQQAIDAYKEQK